MAEVLAMVIDDQKTMRMIIRQLLGQISITNIIEAESGQAAVNLLNGMHTRFPDIIICDLHMADMDGMQFVTEIRRGKTPLPRTHPVIILTGDSDRFLLDVAEQAGATKVLQKPISSAALKKFIIESIGFDYSKA